MGGGYSKFKKKVVAYKYSVIHFLNCFVCLILPKAKLFKFRSSPFYLIKIWAPVQRTFRPLNSEVCEIFK